MHVGNDLLLFFRLLALDQALGWPLQYPMQIDSQVGLVNLH